MARNRIVQCFLLTPSDLAQHSLRRFQFSKASDQHHHDTTIVIDRVPFKNQACTSGQTPDARWPKRCSCGYEFVPSDEWQVRYDQLYCRSDNREFTTLHDAPVGAMWNADWMERKGPDGVCLVVRTPGGEWMVDGPASNGPGWKRSGVLPNVTASPSILIPARGGNDSYHGFLRSGRLEEC